MLVVQVRSSVMCTPRNLVLLTLSTVEVSMVSGGWSTEFLLKLLSDQGTNFKGGSKELEDTFHQLQPNLREQLAKEKI